MEMSKDEITGRIMISGVTPIYVLEYIHLLLFVGDKNRTV
jgi:hypothetical protein